MPNTKPVQQSSVPPGKVSQSQPPQDPQELAQQTSPHVFTIPALQKFSRNSTPRDVGPGVVWPSKVDETLGAFDVSEAMPEGCNEGATKVFT